MPKAIGIDLGTTNSVVSFLENERPEVIPNPEGKNTTPSVVMIDETEGIIVGELAKRQLVSHPERVVRSVKRFMGLRYDEAQDKCDGIHYDIQPGENGEVLVEMNGNYYSPEQISAEILIKMRDTAEEFLGDEVNQAVITVPAYFNDSQRTATKKAAELAGLQVLRIVNEPTAAALAYGLNKEKDEKVAVFDFGGGTFDITILELNDDVFEVISTNGDTALGGDDIDQVLFNFVSEKIGSETGIALSDPAAIQRVREAVELVKCELSTVKKSTVHLPFIVADASGPKHFSYDMSREEFNELIKPILDRLLIPCKNAINDAEMTQEDIDVVLMVGGSSRIPAVNDLVKEFFGQEPNKCVNPDESVALGASIQAGVITGSLEEVLLLDVTPLSLGIELAGKVFSTLIPRNTSIPISVDKTFTTVVDNQKSVQVHVLQGERKVAEENRTLAHLKLNGIAPAPREVPEINVRFHLDANGILNVTATDITSGATKEVTIINPMASTDSVDDVLNDAEKHSESDREFMKTQRRILQAKRFSEMIQAFIDNYGSELSEMDEQLFKEKMFRLDVKIQERDLPGIADAEAELMALGEKNQEVFYSHKAAYGQ